VLRPLVSHQFFDFFCEPLLSIAAQGGANTLHFLAAVARTLRSASFGTDRVPMDRFVDNGLLPVENGPGEMTTAQRTHSPPRGAGPQNLC